MDRIQPLLTHSLHLGSRLYVQAGVRYLVSGAILAGTFLAWRVLGIQDLDVWSLVAVGLVLAGYNTVVVFLVRPHRRPGEAASAHLFLKRVLHATVILDYLALAAVVWLVGGTRSPFLPFFVLQLVNSILLSRRAALLTAAFGYGVLVALVSLEYLSVLTPRMPLGAVADLAPVDPRYYGTVLVTYGMLFALTSTLLLGFSELLRRGEERLRTANEELERLGDFRRDFLHIALHNVQAPVGAVTMLLQNMRHGLGGPLTELQGEWLDRCLVRLREMNSFVRDLRLLGSLEGDPLAQGTEDLDLVPLLEEVLQAYRDSAADAGHEMLLELPPRLPPVRGVERLIREAVVNYVTNAIKYTPQGGRIVLRAAYEHPNVRIEVEDNGIGISEAGQKRLFQEFVRLQHTSSSRPKIPGEGLGLSIVRKVAEAHGGAVGVESAPDRGSRFYLLLPALAPAERPSAAAAEPGHAEPRSLREGPEEV
jgi:signal transduction histidine kinase